jgi:hypothetical protein
MCNLRRFLRLLSTHTKNWQLHFLLYKDVVYSRSVGYPDALGLVGPLSLVVHSRHTPTLVSLLEVGYCCLNCTPLNLSVRSMRFVCPLNEGLSLPFSLCILEYHIFLIKILTNLIECHPLNERLPCVSVHSYSPTEKLC